MDFGEEPNNVQSPQKQESPQLKWSPARQSLYETLCEIYNSSYTEEEFWREWNDLCKGHQKFVREAKDKAEEKERVDDWLFAVARFRGSHQELYQRQARKFHKQRRIRRERGQKEIAGQGILEEAPQLSALGEKMLIEYRKGRGFEEVRAEFLALNQYDPSEVRLQAIIAHGRMHGEKARVKRANSKKETLTD